MANILATKARIDGWLTGQLAAVEAYQVEPYWQGLETHTAEPAHTTAADGDIAPDRMNESPTDQQLSWSDAGIIPAPITTWPCSLQVNVYDGPNGTGYEVVARFTHNGDEWGKVVNYGGETGRESGWIMVNQ